jgi:predicted DNA-binding transcriptional regulator AlpA
MSVLESLEEDRLVDEKTVDALEGGISRVTRWRWEKGGRHPRRLKLGRQNRWRLSEIRTFIRLLKAS